MMDIVRSTFINEAQELLQELDVALLTLENNPRDASGIEHVFRVMHTLKGNSKMFDFLLITETVHDLETVYELVRNGDQAIHKELLDCSFAALDHLKAILLDPECMQPENAEQHRLLLSRIQQLNHKDVAKSAGIHLPDQLHTFHVFFAPSPDFFRDGSNPLFILEELAALGRHLMVPHFQDFDPSEVVDPEWCYTYWDIFLETKVAERDIREVFVFAEGNASISIQQLEYSGLLDADGFVKAISSGKYQDLPLDKSKIAQWAHTFGTPLNTTFAEGASSRTQAVNVDRTFSSVRVGSEKLEELMNLVSELITTQAGLSLFAEQHQYTELETITEIIEKLSRRLRDVAFGMTLIPINNLFNRFQRMVRDISGELGKQVQLLTLGGETELDKSIIESLADPLMHIIRNSVDHGIEHPQTRLKNGKTEMGKITLEAYYSGVFVYIRITDDGQGINPKVVREKAITKGIISAEQALTDPEILELIFHPGFSTAEQVTELSGRGVGMDVVHKNINSLRGSVAVDSQLGKGTIITIKLPLTLSIIDGLLVSIGTDKYLLPLAVVEKCHDVQNKQLMNNFNQLLVLDGVQYPFINLRENFGHPIMDEGRSQAILVRHNDQSVVLITDQIIGEYQAVVKPLGKYFQQQDFVSGATILGDGSIALILDSYKIVELYIEQQKRMHAVV